jgi:hypothetical protein
VTLDNHWLADDRIGSLFLEECQRAATDPEVFKTFRQLPHIQNVVENRQEDWMDRFLDPVRNSLPNYGELIAIATLIDTVGSPPIAKPPPPPISPTTAGYLMVYAALRKLFGPLAGKRIVEIGGGYGGQAAVTCMAEQVASYTIIDLPQPCDLQWRFLRALGVTARCVTSPPGDECDLCVSSCAFAELDEAARTNYVERVLSKSRSGWLTWNWPPEPTDGWIEDPRVARDWLASKMPGVDVRLGREPGPYRELIGSWADLHIYWGATA